MALALYDQGIYDLDTYDIDTSPPPDPEEPEPDSPYTGEQLKIAMTQVVAMLAVLIASPLESRDELIVELEQIIIRARLSSQVVEPSGSVKTWGFLTGRAMAEDVADSADALLHEVRLAPAVPTSRDWQRVYRSIHPSWWSFYHSPHTT